MRQRRRMHRSFPAGQRRAVTGRKQGSGTIDYVDSWPSGFSTNSALYRQYNNTPKSASETSTAKTTVSASNGGYLYYHWCRGNYTAARSTARPARTIRANLVLSTRSIRTRRLVPSAQLPMMAAMSMQMHPAARIHIGITRLL